MDYDPLCVIVGSGRCGTTLLADQLREHPDLESFFELPSLSIWLARLRSAQWPPPQREFALDRDNIYLATTRDRGYNWRVSTSEALAFQRLLSNQPKERSNPVEAIRSWANAYHKAQLKRSDRLHLIHKTPGLSRFIPEFRRVFPKTKILHALRHPCAVIASYRRVPWGPQNVEAGIDCYIERVAAARRASKLLGNDFLEVRYEDLIESPTVALDQILDWLQIDRRDHKWSVVSRSSRATSWEHELSEEEIDLILERVGTAIPEIGYTRSSHSSKPSFRKFMFSVEHDFHQSNPWFDNSKLAAYKNVATVVSPPRIICTFTSDDISLIEKWSIPREFALKSDTGHSSRLVWLLKQGKDRTWRDVVRNSVYSETEVRSIARNATLGSRGRCTIVEELLSRGGRIAPDCKVYVSRGAAKLVMVAERMSTGLRVNFFDKNLDPIPLRRLFSLPEATDTTKLLVFEDDIRSAISSAEALACHHRTSLCRYDFLLADGGVYFGEISPFCGGLAYWQPTEELTELLGLVAGGVSEEPMNGSAAEATRSFVLLWLTKHKHHFEDFASAYRGYISSTDVSGYDMPYEDFVRVAEAWIREQRDGTV